jgi:polar amino acid transport system substrate-binding protein
MKKAIVALALASTLFFFTLTPVSAGPVMDRILEKGILNVGIAGTQPPFNAVSKSGEIIGLDADLANLMAGAMEVRVNFSTMPFSELLPALQQGKIDIILSSMTMTLARNKKVAFVGPYYISGKGILTKTKTIAALQSTAGLNNPELRVAALKGSTSQVFIEKGAPKATLVTTPTYDDAIKMLIDDKIDAIIADLPFCAVSAFRYADKGLTAGESRLSFEPIGIAVPEDPLLINWIENYLKLLNGSGQLQVLQNRWFKDGAWIKELAD